MLIEHCTMFAFSILMEMLRKAVIICTRIACSADVIEQRTVIDLMDVWMCMTIIIVHDKRASAITNVTNICVKCLIRGALPSRVEYNEQSLNNGPCRVENTSA